MYTISMFLILLKIDKMSNLNEKLMLGIFEMGKKQPSYDVKVPRTFLREYRQIFVYKMSFQIFCLFFINTATFSLFLPICQLLNVSLAKSSIQKCTVKPVLSDHIKPDRWLLIAA